MLGILGRLHHIQFLYEEYMLQVQALYRTCDDDTSD